MLRSPVSTSAASLRGACRTLAVVAVLVAASACGGSSSGGGKANASQTFAAALKLQKEGKLSQAAQLYQQVLQATPGNVYAHYNVGVIDQAMNNTVGALAAYGAALTINPKYVPALYNEATIYTGTDQPLAISIYRQIVLLQPTAPTAYLNLGLLEIKHGEPKRGVSDLATAVKQNSALLSSVPKHLRGLVSALVSPSQSSSPSGQSTPTQGSTPTNSPS